MLPILETYFGFDSSMLSRITALYILFDPVITCTNVLGNGAFTKMMDRIWIYRKRSLLFQSALNSDGN
jgi:Na+/H+-dicarboxylate symporter